MDSLVFGLVPFIFITIGIFCIIKSESAYSYNLKMVENYAESVKNIPLFGQMAKANVEFYKFVGVWFIKFWGILALIIGTANVFAIFHQGFK